jgi:Mrp family chromosome partitioning ATPase
MLKETHRQHRTSGGQLPDREDGRGLIIPPRFSSIVRHKRLVLQVTACFVFLAVLFSIVRSDSYTAISRLLIDNKNLQLGRQDAVFARTEVDVPLIQNQIELLRSEMIANQVIDNFKLADDPEFVAGNGFFRFPNGSQSAEERRRLALDSFKRRLYVGRIGDSYTLEIRFTANTPEQASDIANKIGAEYMNLLARSNAKVAQSASLWLRTRLVEMGPNASVITSATPPIRKDGPNSFMVLCAAALVGLMFGVTSAFAADAMDRTIRTPSQASAVTGTECFGIVPLISGRNVTFEAIRNPRSFAAHTIRRALAAIRDRSDLKIIGVTSIFRNEGKTEIAANLAQVAAASGSRVLLIDAATYSGKLSRLLAPEAKTGLVDLLGGRASLMNVLWTVSESNLRFLPVGQILNAQVSPSNSFSGLQHILSEAVAVFDFIIVDLPPATPMADVREASVAFDGFVLVVEWGTTLVDVLESAMISQEDAMQKVLGTIVNKVDVQQLKTYDPALAAIFDQRKYSGYVNSSNRPGWFRAKNKKEDMKRWSTS